MRRETNLKSGGSGDIRKKIRDAQRLLRKDDLPANVRVEQERRVKALEQQLSQRHRGELERKYAKRYHMLKFVERQKLTRKLKTAKQQLANLEAAVGDENVRSEIERRIFDLEVDMFYVQFYCKSVKYISLFPSPPCTDEKILQRQEQMRQRIRDAMRNNTTELIKFTPYFSGITSASAAAATAATTVSFPSASSSSSFHSKTTTSARDKKPSGGSNGDPRRTQLPEEDDFFTTTTTAAATAAVTAVAEEEEEEEKPIKRQKSKRKQEVTEIEEEEEPPSKKKKKDKQKKKGMQKDKQKKKGMQKDKQEESVELHNGK